jgi:chromosome partitioning protein
MKVVVVASQKGGVGKTTLTGHLAVAAASKGHHVCIIDSDPQGSLSSWWNEREKQDISFVPSSLNDLDEVLKKLRNAKVDFVLIDTPPSITNTIDVVVELADLVIVPTRASPHDLRALSATMDIINLNNKKMFFVVNGAANRARITTEAVIELSQHGPVCPAVIYQRTEFATSMIDGRTVLDVNNKSKSASEIAELWIYVNKQLHKKGNVK